MTMHLLRRASASHSDTFGRYEIRGIFPIVKLVEQAEASNIPPVCQGVQIRRKSRFCTRSSRSSQWDHPRYGNSTPYMGEW